MAVGLFVDKGYNATSLKDLTRAAGLSPGAFYYHFRSKEELAEAIIDEAWPQVFGVVNGHAGQPEAGLEQLITMTFELAALYRTVPAVRVAAYLDQAYIHLGESGRRDFGQRVDFFCGIIAACLRPSELRPDLSLDDVSELCWSLITGFQLQSDAHGDDAAAGLDRLMRTWRALLCGCLPETSLPGFDRFLARTAEKYAPRAPEAPTGPTPTGPRTLHPPVPWGGQR